VWSCQRTSRTLTRRPLSTGPPPSDWRPRSERASLASRLERHDDEGTGGEDEGDDAAEPTDAAEVVDKTDMNAVGDDGQVFGG
jgi:hypothetical protein